jgi:Uma2 family endonuclease
VHVRDRPFDPKRVGAGDASHRITPPNGRALLARDPGDDAVHVGTGGGQLELPPRLDDFLVESADGQYDAFDLSGSDLPRDAGGGFELFHFDGSLLGLGAGLVERLVRDEAVLPQLLALGGAVRQDLHVEPPALGLGLKVEQLPVERQGQARFLVGLRGDAVLEAGEVEPRGAGVQLDDGVAHAHGVAGPLEDAEHAAFEGGDDRPLGRRHDHACRVQRRFDPPELDAPDAKPRSRNRRPQPPGEQRESRDHEDRGHRRHRPTLHAASQHGRVVERSIHVSPLRFVRAIAMPGSPGVKRRRDVWCAPRTVRFRTVACGSGSSTGDEGRELDCARAQPYRSGMEPPARASRLTAYDLASLPDDERRHELEEGWLVSEPLPSLRHDRVRRTLERILEAHVANHGLGEVFGEAGFVLARNPDTVRGPDLSFVARERLVGIDYGRFFDGAPDLAIEILSPSNRPGQVRAKVADYLAAGCHLVWVVDPEARTVTTYRSLLFPRVLGADDALDGIDLLPGLTIQVASIFEV